MMSVRADTFFSKHEILELMSALRLSSELETRDLISDMDSCIEKQLVHPLCEVVEAFAGFAWLAWLLGHTIGSSRIFPNLPRICPVAFVGARLLEYN